MKSFAAQDKYASYVIELVDTVIIARITGAIGESLTSRFCQDMKHIIQEISSNGPWGYLGYMAECEGYTSNSEPLLIENSLYSSQHGCMVDAYVIPSPVARSQLGNTRIKAGIASPMEKHLFESEEQAMDFLNHHLANIRNALSHST